MFLQSSTVREKLLLQCSAQLKRYQSQLRCSLVSVLVISLLACAIIRQLFLSPSPGALLLVDGIESSDRDGLHKGPTLSYSAPSVRYVKTNDIQAIIERASKSVADHAIAMPFGPIMENILQSHFGSGEIRILIGTEALCIDTMSAGMGGAPGAYPCHHQGGTQAWSYSTGKKALESTSPGMGCIGVTQDGTVKLVDCASKPPERRTWHWKSSGQLVIDSAATVRKNAPKNTVGPETLTVTASLAGNLCLAVVVQPHNKHKKSLRLKPCASYFGPLSPYNAHQRWVLAKAGMQTKAEASAMYDFDQVNSAAIGVRRKVPDIRAPGCKRHVGAIHKEYGLTPPAFGMMSRMFRGAESFVKRLEPTSIIICFVDEEWWALLRTLHSVLDRSPAVLVHEIILLDDGSEAPHLGPPLDAYVSALPSLPKVRIVRTHERLGLIKARLLGADEATSDVLTFLDSHIEVADGWLEPLLVRLTEKSDVIVTPQIVVTSQDTLMFQTSISHDNIAYGQFNWDLVFHWTYTHTETPPGPTRTQNTDSVESPAMAGGIYSIRKSYFQRIGSYDDEMEGWGAENVEMSMRIWMCGGSIELIPCSIVSHIFRQKNPTKFPGTDVHKVIMHNRKRTVDVWFDPPHRDLFYHLHASAQNTASGDVSKRLALRDALHCRSFEWYAKHFMANIFAPIPQNLRDRGQIRISASADSSDVHFKCLGLQQTKPEASPCPCKAKVIDCGQGQDVNTNFYFTKEGELRGTDWPRIKWCLMEKHLGADQLTVDVCNVAPKDLERQRWALEPSDDRANHFLLRHVASGRCLVATLGGDDDDAVKLETCDRTSALQRVSFRTTYGGRYSGIHDFPVDTSTKKASAKIPRHTLLSGKGKSIRRSDDTTENFANSRARNLQTISVVLPCASESLLMVNTVRSIYENTPSDVLAEIIVVDDGSETPLVTLWPADDADPSGVEGVPMEGFDPNPKAGHWGAIKRKVLFLRHKQIMGLMQSRMTGANAATGDIVAMFDCHVKPDKNWWHSVLSEISENYRRVTVPVITRLDVTTWREIGRRPNPGGGMSACYFAWDSEFKWASNRFWRPGQKRWVPIMSGGLLAMSREWWGELGGYDEEMKGWGGENIDQSLRIWLCGGEIVSLDDSFVAHMWRDSSRPETRKHYRLVGNSLRNRWRAVSAWLGDFKAKTLTFPDFRGFRSPTPAEDLQTYEIVKSRLQCNTFEWYIDRFSNIFHKAGILPKTVFQLESQRAPGLCLERTGSVLGHAKIAHGPLSLAPCNKEERMQFFHRANQADDGECCSGLRGFDSDQCVRYSGQFDGDSESIDTAVCSIDGSNPTQIATLGVDGRIVLGGHHDRCLQVVPAAASSGDEDGAHAWALSAVPCDRAIENSAPKPKNLPKWNKLEEHTSLERQIYDRSKVATSARGGEWENVV